VSKASFTVAPSKPSDAEEFRARNDDSLRAAIKVFLMDLWCYTPYYDRYLYESLLRENTEVALGAVCPYEEPRFFVKHGLRNDPGLVDVVSKLGISSNTLRRLLMFVECVINMVALAIRFATSKPDVVHVQWIPLIRKFPFEFWFLRLMKAWKIKVVYTVHNVLPHDTGSTFAPVFRRVYKAMDALICHTEAAKRRLVQEFSVEPDRVWTIPHGPLLHDVERHSTDEAKVQLSIPQGTTLVLWQGMIRPYKGLDFLLDGWSKVDAQGLHACLLVAGTGEAKLRKSIADQVMRLGLEGSVRLDLRFITDQELSTYYSAADVVVFPYSNVTTSGALMTAAAYRKAIIATKLPAFQETLIDNETALLVDYGDADALAEALTTLILKPMERERLAHRIEDANQFRSWDYIAKKTRQCYAAVLQDRMAQIVSR
jgi:glycosyltransferase involved in cell wall biosynthesis